VHRVDLFVAKQILPSRGFGDAESGGEFLGVRLVDSCYGDHFHIAQSAYRLGMHLAHKAGAEHRGSDFSHTVYLNDLVNQLLTLIA
jgi:hypothetical protein